MFVKLKVFFVKSIQRFCYNLLLAFKNGSLTKSPDFGKIEFFSRDLDGRRDFSGL